MLQGVWTMVGRPIPRHVDGARSITTTSSNAFSPLDGRELIARAEALGLNIRPPRTMRKSGLLPLSRTLRKWCRLKKGDSNDRRTHVNREAAG